jgi:hypothetical protein
MNLDLSIHRMAFRETSSLGLAQVLVAQKRAALDNQLTQQRADEGVSSTPNAVLERTVSDMQLLSDQKVKAAERHQVDKLA